MCDATPPITQSIISEMRADLALANRAAPLADSIVRDIRTPGPHIIVIDVPPHRADDWLVTITHPDGTVRELTMRKAGKELLDGQPA